MKSYSVMQYSVNEQLTKMQVCSESERMCHKNLLVLKCPVHSATRKCVCAVVVCSTEIAGGRVMCQCAKLCELFVHTGSVSRVHVGYIQFRPSALHECRTSCGRHHAVGTQSSGTDDCQTC